MAWLERKQSGSFVKLVWPILLDLARNPIMLAIAFGLIWRFTGLGMHPVVDRTVELLAQAGSPTALIALGINLVRFEIRGGKLSIAMMCLLKLLVMPAAAWLFAWLLKLPPIVIGVVVLLAAMPTGANAYIFAVQYRRLVNPVSGAVALATILSAATLPIVVTLLAAAR